MMKHEFELMTGVEVSLNEYKEIENQYMSCNDDKQEFCKNWVLCNSDRAKEVEKAQRKKIREEKAKEKDERLAEAIRHAEDQLISYGMLDFGLRNYMCQEKVCRIIRATLGTEAKRLRKVDSVAELLKRTCVFAGESQEVINGYAGYLYRETH